MDSLDREWQTRSAAPQAAAEAAARELSRFLQEHVTGKATLQEIQGQSEEYRERSQELRELRRNHAEAVLQVLTDAQRQHIERLAGY